MDPESAGTNYRFGTDKMLMASAQLAFLAAALIASADLWKSGNPDLAGKAYFGLVISIFLSVFTHFFVGFTYIVGTQKLQRGGTYGASGFHIFPAWLVAVLQFIFAAASMILIAIIYAPAA